ncbi:MULTISPECIES: hypothetical protein [unclassified Microbacterium]|uniref:hypothetical protein n=1 Tax=unclassified Microbacterium TaxID=2609290 RepID=UPI00341819C8
MTACDNSDHDGAQVPAIVRIEVEGARPMERCLWCAEGASTALMRAGVSFAVTAHEWV